MGKLTISDLEIRNFLSYGDYDTNLHIDGLGPILIVGNKDDSDGFQDSNGSGKSALTTAIIWCLFGRTFSKDKPGDKIVNWDTGENCVVTIKTTDGWEISRTRKTEGRNELSISLNGEDRTLSTTTNTQQFIDDLFGLDFDIFVSSTFFGQFSKPFLEMADAKRRAALERLLNLDRLNLWASVAKSKTEKTEQAATKCSISLSAYEAELTRLNDQLLRTVALKDEYDKTRSIKIEEFEKQIVNKKKERNSIDVPDIERLKIRWDAICKIDDKVKEYQRKESAIKTSIIQNREKINSNNDRIAKCVSKVNGGKKYDIDQLKKEHVISAELSKKIIDTTSAINVLRRKMMEKEVASQNIESSIRDWDAASGTICPKCKQKIGKEHAIDMCGPMIDNVSKLKIEIESIASDIKFHEDLILKLPPIPKIASIEDAIKINSSIQMMLDDIEHTTSENNRLSSDIIKYEADLIAIDDMLRKVAEQARQSTPTITIDSAMRLKSLADLLDQSILNLKTQVDSLSIEANPHCGTIDLIKSQIAGISKKIGESDATRLKFNMLFEHLSYIKSAYGDRNKIKQFVLMNMMPILNRRIQYYLEAFSCDFGIEFTPTLSVLPSKWDYDLCSGGERKRIDMAMMFALHDLFINMYGQQCNIMVLDEVDGALDSRGVESFTEVIMNDFCGNLDSRPKPSTIMIISHKTDLLDAFPSKISVRKRGTFSYIESNI